MSGQIRLPPRRQLPFTCSISSYSAGLLFLPTAAAAASPRQPRRRSLGAPCSRSPGRPPASCRPLVAAPRVRARPRGGRCWEAGAGTKLIALRFPNLGPSAARGQGSPPPPRKTWQKPEVHAKTGWCKKSLPRMLGSPGLAPEALAAFPAATAPPSGPCRACSTAPSGRTRAAPEAGVAKGGTVSSSALKLGPKLGRVVYS